MKKFLFALLLLVSPVVYSQTPAVTIGGDYCYTFWGNPVWSGLNTANPVLVSLPIGAAFNYQLTVNGALTTAQSGPQLSPSVPTQIVVDFLRSDLVGQTVAIKDPATNQNITISLGGIVTALQAVFQLYRAGPPAPPSH